MDQNFVLPSGLIGKFAIVKLWPDIKTAEDECIARLKIAAANFGIECIEIHADGRTLESPHHIITKKDVDFVLHLHYDTPKLYDAFSLVALWNPMQFYHEWGYARTSRNLLTHDDFVSCSSQSADDHVSRLIRNKATHLPPLFNLYHSVAYIVHSPSLGDFKLFYAGINWDALRGGVSRHQVLLQKLDKTGDLRIFGPTIFQGVRVWKGYQSYVREIPFDGISMIDEISKAGIALVLSSQAHKDSELMSNRLFESVAAGALVICDENNFAKKFFGDALLYVDSRCSVEDIASTIDTHVQWVKNNPSLALEMVKKSQSIFREKFSLNQNLKDLYLGLSQRKQQLIERQNPADAHQASVCLYLLMPEYSEQILNKHIESASSQTYKNFVAVLVIDGAFKAHEKQRIKDKLANLSIVIYLHEVDFFSYGIDANVQLRKKMGQVFYELLTNHLPSEAVVFVAPNESVFSNHIQVLAGALNRNIETTCVASAVIYKNNQPIHGISERIDFRELNSAVPIGYARFIFRVSTLPKDLNIALPYLDRKVMAVLVENSVIQHEIPSTVVIDVADAFPQGQWDENQENCLIASYCPKVFSLTTGNEIILPHLSTSPSALSSAVHGMKRLSWNWVQAQIMQLRRDGLMARVNVLKSRINKVKA